MRLAYFEGREIIDIEEFWRLIAPYAESGRVFELYLLGAKPGEPPPEFVGDLQSLIKWLYVKLENGQLTPTPVGLVVASAELPLLAELEESVRAWARNPSLRVSR